MSDNSESDSDVLNDEKGNNDFDHSASRGKHPKRKPRKSMDCELHDHLEYNNYGDDSNSNDGGGKCGHLGKDELAKSTESARGCDFDSDEDTFADADSDCEPNQYYLDEMLEDIHPERLNLLEYRKKEQNKTQMFDMKSSSIPSISETQFDENEDNDSEYSLFNKNLEGSDTSRLDDDDIENDGDSGGDGRDRFGTKGNLNPDKSENETDRVDEDEDETDTDTFGSLPTATREKGKRRSQMGLNNFGSSADAAGPGSPILRQPSCKAVWGK